VGEVRVKGAKGEERPYLCELHLLARFGNIMLHLNSDDVRTVFCTLVQRVCNLPYINVANMNYKTIKILIKRL